MGDEVGAFEEQKYITEAATLQGTVQSNPVCILRGKPAHLALLPAFLDILTKRLKLLAASGENLLSKFEKQPDFS